jgi:biotin carboxyl carrier protein
MRSRSSQQRTRLRRARSRPVDRLLQQIVDVRIWSFTLLVATAAVIAAVLFLPLGGFTHGIAVVRAKSWREVSAARRGVVGAVHAKAGMPIRKGSLVVEFERGVTLRERDALRNEFELHLLRWLRDPNDAQAKLPLTQVRADLRRAELELQEQQVFAPTDGTVLEVPVRPGQPVAEGDRLVTIADTSVDCAFEAILSGEVSPMVDPGDDVLLTIPQLSNDKRRLTVTKASGVLSQKEALNKVTPELAFAVGQLTGSALIVEGAIPDCNLATPSGDVRLRHGMHANLAVRVQSRSLLQQLLPGSGEVVRRF